MDGEVISDESGTPRSLWGLSGRRAGKRASASSSSDLQFDFSLASLSALFKSSGRKKRGKPRRRKERSAMASEEDRESHVCIAKPAEQPERDDYMVGGCMSSIRREMELVKVSAINKHHQSDSGAADISVKHTGVNGHPPEAVQKPSGHLSSSTKSTSSWDSDWGSMLKKTTSSYRAEESNLPPKSAATTSEPTPVSNPRFQSTSAPDLHVPLSCPAVDIEWPPLAPTIDQSSQVAENDKQKSNPQLPGDSGFDEIDPFADWPPRPTHTVNNSLGSMINNSTGMPNQGKPVMGANLASTINNSMGMSMQNQGRPAPNANPASLPLNNSIGLSKLYEQTSSSTINTTSSSSFPINSSVGRGTSAIQTASKEVDLESMFPSAKSEQPPALRIAPPPPAGKSGGGRGNWFPKNEDEKPQVNIKEIPSKHGTEI
ncbi:hypothetical protein EJ110_NYTH12688 [Nymphaea thermarum]|nr:hypothetical protein EJ110_NYTH12688 [Nymphaea thermarum]